jgi:hypothetical protein
MCVYFVSFFYLFTVNITRNRMQNPIIKTLLLFFVWIRMLGANGRTSGKNKYSSNFIGIFNYTYI